MSMFDGQIVVVTGGAHGIGRATCRAFAAQGATVAVVDIDGDGKPDVTFSAECGFVLQLRDGRVIAAEADRDVTAIIQGKTVALKRYQPAR